MPWTDKHIKWLKDTGEIISTEDGKSISIYEFKYEKDDEILSAWARHFRNHYCSDSQIDDLRCGTRFSRTEYLDNLIFPDSSITPGPSIRAGDFGEILTADYLEYVLKYWVPRTRFDSKTVRNESIKGSDIIGFRILQEGKDSLGDTLAVFEAKAQFSGGKAKSRLQNAVDDSGKDIIRKAESLNAIKRRLIEKDKIAESKRVARFQNPEDHPYKEVYGAAALFNSQLFNKEILEKTTTKAHPKQKELFLVVIHGPEMMKLVHELYRRAADEA
jgi:hypothetical protein